MSGETCFISKDSPLNSITSMALQVPEPRSSNRPLLIFLLSSITANAIVKLKPLEMEVWQFRKMNKFIINETK